MYHNGKDCYDCYNCLRIGTKYVCLAHRIEVKPIKNVACTRWENDCLHDDDAMERSFEKNA